MLIQSSLLERVRVAQQHDRLLQEARKRVGYGKPREFTIDENDLVRFRGRLCVPQKSEVKMDILRETHKTPYTVHPSETKMYKDLKQNFWWKRMKVDVSKYVAACEVCQRVKAEHKRPASLLKPCIGNSRVEVGAYHHGFCGWLTSFSSRQGCYMGGSGLLD
jgi:hypothetical protein